MGVKEGERMTMPLWPQGAVPSKAGVSGLRSSQHLPTPRGQLSMHIHLWAGSALRAFLLRVCHLVYRTLPQRPAWAIHVM